MIARGVAPSVRVDDGCMARFRRDRFDGHIAGVGTTSGRRFVVGRWGHSPLGAFADVMVAHPDGRREFLAPNDVVAEYVSQTYRFDDVTITSVGVVGGDDEWHVRASELDLRLTFGARMPLSLPLRAVRGPLVHPVVARIADPFARVVMPGVRTAGSAGNGRREFYVAQDLHAVMEVSGTWAGVDVGALADVSPEPGFGFSSTPRRPSLTTVTTFVEVP